MDSSEELDQKSKIYYFFRMKYWIHMINTSKEGLSKFKGDSSFHLYHALSLILVNRLEEGIHVLETVSRENEVKLAVSIALIYAHKHLGVDNKELFSKLEAQMKEYRKNCEPNDCYYAAFVLLCFKKLDKSLEFVERAVTMQSSSAEFLSLKGWILIEMGAMKYNALKELFKSALQINNKYLDAVLGYTECCIRGNDTTEAINRINKAIVSFSSTNLPLIQKLRIQLSCLEWDQAKETLHRIIGVDPKNVYARKMVVVLALCSRVTSDETITHLKQFAKTLESTENGNMVILIESIDLFTKICDRNSEILLETTKTLDKALQKFPDNIDLLIELGNQSIIRNNMKDAVRYFKSALGIEETSFKALLGLSICEFAENGNSEKLKEQIQYLKESKYALDSSLFHLLMARACENTEEKTRKLYAICERKLLLLNSCPFSDTNLQLLEPNIMIDVAKEYIRDVSKIKNSKSSHTSVHNILNLILKWCPESRNTMYLLAKMLYIKGDISSALRSLERLFKRIDDPITDAQLLMAQIEIQLRMFERATLTLESCVSNNFEVRDNPLYHYLSGLVDKNAGNFADAIKSFSTALNLMNTNVTQFDMVDKGTVFVEFIDTLHIVGQNDEAERVLEDATEELKDTPNQAMILLLSADHAMKRHNIQDALDLISRIKRNDPCYTEAKRKQADIFLNYRRDKYAYITIYKDIVNDTPNNSEALVMLGDAYMKILEPDDALECYKKALDQDPDDPNLMLVMGKALVNTHYFSRAVIYYEEAIKKTNDPNLKLQLAELHMNMKQYEKGELILLNEIEIEQRKKNDDMLDNLRHQTKLFMLLAQIQEKSGNITYALKSLKDAMDSQSRLRRRIAISQNVVPEEEINILVEIAMKMGEMAIALKNNEQAVHYYKDGLEASPDNITILVALAKIYMQMNYLELCQQTCSTILELFPENESASVMMADIAFRKVDFDMASYHFTQLVTKQPLNYEALIRLIQILRRTGKIEDAVQFLNTTETYVSNPSKDTRFLYCKALYQMYSGNLNSALRNFNLARNDPIYGKSAIYNMIEICLSPDDEMLADQFMDTDDIEYKDSRSMALKTADRLLRELNLKLANADDVLNVRILHNFCLLAAKDKYSIDRALEDFIHIATEPLYKDHIAITLGIATCYTLLKQTQRAKNQLKRVNKVTWTFEDAEYLERCWLLLADYYIQSNKFEIATDLINKVITYNRSCTKAYEYLGHISEKEQRYKEAVHNYELAWKCGGKSNPAVGYKYAYVLMKSKIYPEAINIAQAVLKLNPEYPKIKKDILDKCMNNLRI